MKLINLKNLFVTNIGMVGSFISSLFGGWSSAMSTLMIFMLIDYFTGLVVAGVFHNSDKSESGALESRAGIKGIFRKGMCLLIILIAHRLDLVFGSNFIQNSVIITFIANEAISIIENAGLMGVNMPKRIVSAIEILRGKDTELTEEEINADRNSRN